MVVDDDHAIRKLLERIGKRAGFEVATAKDGLEALEMLDVSDYDVALIDLMMPRLSGYELVARLGMREKRPVVMVATALTTADIATVDDTLVRQVVRKPFDIHALMASLNEAAGEVQAKREGKAPMIPIAAPPEEETAGERKSDSVLPEVNPPLPC